MSSGTIADSAGDGVVMLNLFSVAPQGQSRLVQRLGEMTEQAFSRQPGFINGAIHRSHDGLRVFNYARWCRPADLLAAQKVPLIADMIAESRTLGMPEWGFYDLVSSHRPR